MRFPGHRIAKHYFPVTKKRSRVGVRRENESQRWNLLGLDQIVVDVEVKGSADLLEELGLEAGESVLWDDEVLSRWRDRLNREACRVSAGGAVGNTVNNFTYLSGEPATLLGAIGDGIRPGEPAFQYVAQTPGAVDLGRLRSVPGSIATAFTFIGPEGDRTFAVAPGISNEYPEDALPVEVVRQAPAVLTTLYCLRDPAWPIARAAERMMREAKDAGVPVALGMGTAGLVRERQAYAVDLLKQYVNLAAMNADEAEALTGEQDALLACRKLLDWVDLVIITEGDRGLTMGGWVDERYKRQTDQKIRSKSIPEYNRYEYSRLMCCADCPDPLKVFSHIHPYRGGPDRLKNTNGAGDAALAAVLHDICANRYHRTTVPESDKHAAPVEFLTYSSLSRIAQYGNRVAYEVLKGNSPRLNAPVGPDEEG